MRKDELVQLLQGLPACVERFEQRSSVQGLLQYLTNDAYTKKIKQDETLSAAVVGGSVKQIENVTDKCRTCGHRVPG